MMIDPRFTVREDLKRDGRSEHRLIAFYGPVYTDQYGDQEIRCIASTQYGRNPPVEAMSIFAEYVERFSRPISEEEGRKLHPRMYDYLEAGTGLSTMTLYYRNQKTAYVSFDEGPTLYKRMNWHYRGTEINSVELVGSIETIERIRKKVLSPGNQKVFIQYLSRFSRQTKWKEIYLRPGKLRIAVDILPATYEDVWFAARYYQDLGTIENVRHYLLSPKKPIENL